MRIPVISAFLLGGASMLATADPRGDLKAATLQGAPEAHHAAIGFLIEHMPEYDLRALKPDFLRENVALAYQARSATAWAKEIPEDVFFNDVLPYATLDEPREAWRASLAARFGKLVASTNTAREAMLKINAAIKADTGVTYNTRRRAANQAPLESISSKMASCTGLSILLVDALRAVGLPARIVGTNWTTMEGNHSWVEVWLPDTKTWAFTEYTPHRDGLDVAWFIPDAARGIPGHPNHGIYATSWRKTQHHFPLAWDDGNQNVAAIDVTQRYIELGRSSLPGPGECALRIEAVIPGLQGSESRRQSDIEIRADGAVVARGKSPSTEDDMNQFLYLIVKQGQTYQISALPNGQQPVRAEAAIGTKDTLRKVTLQVAK